MRPPPRSTRTDTLLPYTTLCRSCRIDSRFNQEAESWSVFGQGTLNLSDAFRIIGSLRYSHTSKDGDFAARLVYGPFAIRPISSAKGSISEGHVDPSRSEERRVGKEGVNPCSSRWSP